MTFNRKEDYKRDYAQLFKMAHSNKEKLEVKGFAIGLQEELNLLHHDAAGCKIIAAFAQSKDDDEVVEKLTSPARLNRKFTTSNFNVRNKKTTWGQ